MAVTITLANGTEFTPYSAASTQVTFENAVRSALEFVFKKSDYTFDELSAMFTENNCEAITFVDQPTPDSETRTDTYEGYVLPVGIAMENRMIKPGTEESAPEYENFFVVRMARRTYAENQIRELQAGVDQALLLALGVAN